MKKYFRVNAAKYAQEKDFDVVRPSSLDNPKDNTVMFVPNKSKVTFVASAIIENYHALGVISDYKMGKGKGTIDPDRINRELITFYKYVHALYPNVRILYTDCDNASQELTNGIRLAFIRANIPVVVRDCWKGLINDRIYALNGLMTRGRFLSMRIVSTLSTVYHLRRGIPQRSPRTFVSTTVCLILTCPTRLNTASATSLSCSILLIKVRK